MHFTIPCAFMCALKLKCLFGLKCYKANREPVTAKRAQFSCVFECIGAIVARGTSFKKTIHHNGQKCSGFDTACPDPF